LIFSLKKLKKNNIKIFDEYKEVYFYAEIQTQEIILKNIENRIIFKKILNEI